MCRLCRLDEPVIYAKQAAVNNNIFFRNYAKFDSIKFEAVLLRTRIRRECFPDKQLTIPQLPLLQHLLTGETQLNRNLI